MHSFIVIIYWLLIFLSFYLVGIGVEDKEKSKILIGWILGLATIMALGISAEIAGRNTKEQELLPELCNLRVQVNDADTLQVIRAFPDCNNILIPQKEN